MGRKKLGNTCTFPGCDRQYEARGYCRRHYKHLRKYGEAREIQESGVCFYPNHWGGSAGVSRSHFRGGRYLNAGGYVMIHVYKDDPIRGKCYYEHRYVMEQHIGRPIRSDEAVHHIDENPQNNELENLKLMSRSEHARLRWEKYREKKARGEILSRGGQNGDD